MKKSGENRAHAKNTGIKNKKVVIKKSVAIKVMVMLFLSLLLAANISAMDAELQLLVEQPGGVSAPVSAASAQSGAGARDASPACPTELGQRRAKLQTKSEDAELYNLIGEQNKHYFKGHDTEQILRVFDTLKLEQHLSFMALQQFDQLSSPDYVRTVFPVTRKKRRTAHGKHAQREHSKSALDRKNKSEQERQTDAESHEPLVSDEHEEKEREQEVAVLAKGRQLAQAEFIAAILSALSQQQKERADKLAQDKEKSESELKEHKEEAVKKDKCHSCLKKTTAITGILGTLAGAWAAVATVYVAQHSK